MKNSFVMTEDKQSLGKRWGWFLGLGLLLILLGIVAIGAASFTTLVSVVFLGFILLMGGGLIMLDAFSNWWGKWKGFTLHLLLGFLYLVAGVFLIKHPISASVSLTLLLGIFYIVVGVFRILYVGLSQAFNRGWPIFSGIISLLLGVLILASWPAAGLYIIGLFVGIDLLFSGWSYVMMGLTAKQWVRGG